MFPWPDAHRPGERAKPMLTLLLSLNIFMTRYETNNETIKINNKRMGTVFSSQRTSSKGRNKYRKENPIAPNQNDDLLDWEVASQLTLSDLEQDDIEYFSTEEHEESDQETAREDVVKDESEKKATDKKNYLASRIKNEAIDFEIPVDAVSVSSRNTKVKDLKEDFRNRLDGLNKMYKSKELSTDEFYIELNKLEKKYEDEKTRIVKEVVEAETAEAAKKAKNAHSGPPPTITYHTSEIANFIKSNPHFKNKVDEAAFRTTPTSLYGTSQTELVGGQKVTHAHVHGRDAIAIRRTPTGIEVMGIGIKSNSADKGSGGYVWDTKPK